jgi:hypothetical protein
MNSVFHKRAKNISKEISAVLSADSESERHDVGHEFEFVSLSSRKINVKS